MYKSYKYRIYPTEGQKALMDKHFGCVRFVYNLALETNIEAYKKGVSLSAFALKKQLTELKPDCVWLGEVSRHALDNSIFNLEDAFKRFFNGGRFPNFKKKSNNNSYTIGVDVSIRGGLLCLPKFQKGIKIVQHRKIIGDPKGVTISKTATNKYFASILVKAESSQLPKTDKSVGVDLGIKTFAVLSDGKEYASPKFLRKSLDRLAVLQRRASRKKKGSANRRKANLRVAICHEQIINQRKDFLHKTSNEITNQNGVICIEDLNVAGMVKNHKLALSISDAGWSEFVRQLTYKSEWKGRQLITVGRFEPTSKTCSSCGLVKPMPLSERVYNCSCGLSIDRDINAAINIRNSGLLRAGAPVELPSLDGTVKQEKCIRYGKDRIINHPTPNN